MMQFTFDGQGVNDSDEYASRLATLTSYGHKRNVGPLLASAPELSEALKVAYQFFSAEADTPDDNGLTVAPDSAVRVVLRKMRQAIAHSEGRV